LPRQYDYYPELFVKAYCLLIPAILGRELGWVTPLVTALITFVLLVLNQIGKNLEDPFNNQVYDTPNDGALAYDRDQSPSGAEFEAVAASGTSDRRRAVVKREDVS